MLTSAQPTTSRADRHQIRRDQILDAAGECFLDHGFHGASMAQVAAATKMSVGQIYRFFAGKEEIISALVARQLELVVDRFPSSGIPLSEMRVALSTGASLLMNDFFDPKHAGLIIEIRAEASRNPAIAEIVRSADKVIGEHIRALIVGASGNSRDPIELERRTRFLATVIDGLIFRSPIDQDLDQSFVDELIDLVCNAVVFREAPATLDSSA